MPTGQSSSRIIWDDAAEKHLLILIVLQSQPSVNWNLVAQKFGQGATPGALMQKYNKIRKRDSNIYGMEDASDNGPEGSANPKTPRSNKRQSKFGEGNTDDEETPTKKKAKTEKAQRMKKESSEYGESEGTTIKLDGDEEDVLEFKIEGDIET